MSFLPFQAVSGYNFISSKLLEFLNLMSAKKKIDRTHEGTNASPRDSFESGLFYFLRFFPREIL